MSLTSEAKRSASIRMHNVGHVLQCTFSPENVEQASRQQTLLIVSELLVRGVSVISIVCFLFVWSQVNYGLTPQDMIHEVRLLLGL